MPFLCMVAGWVIVRMLRGVAKFGAPQAWN
jgi:hypothetical protein